MFSKTWSEWSEIQWIPALYGRKGLYGSFPSYRMKPGKKKTEKDETGSRKPELEEAGSKKTGGDDSGSFRVNSEMIGGNPNGIDGIRALQVIAVGIAVLVVIGWVLHNILHII
jgi:hypothetical protein